MSAMLIVALCLGASPTQGSSANRAAISGEATNCPLTGIALQNAIHDALRHWARPTDKAAAQAAREFLDLYGSLQRDTQISRRTREELQAKLRYRLTKLSAQIRIGNAKSKPGAAAADLASVKVPAAQTGNLAQIGVGPAMGGRGGVGAGIQGFQGPQGSPSAGVADDNGQALVDLIQKTIAPNSWDVNGGPGSIYYWNPGRALVISQTGEVHGTIGGVLGQMQKLGH
jgi:hypothetical protein